MSETTDAEADEVEVDRSHLEVEDGCGCAEVWEHLSEEREAAAAEASDAEADE